MLDAYYIMVTTEGQHWDGHITFGDPQHPAVLDFPAWWEVMGNEFIIEAFLAKREQHPDEIHDDVGIAFMTVDIAKTERIVQICSSPDEWEDNCKQMYLGLCALSPNLKTPSIEELIEQFLDSENPSGKPLLEVISGGKEEESSSEEPDDTDDFI